MTPEEQRELERLRELERYEEHAERAKRDAAIAANPGRDWSTGPPEPPPPRVTVDVETEHGTVRAPATRDRATARAMALEQAGWERDPATGEWRKASWGAA
jgi:hypothetical protein